MPKLDVMIEGGKATPAPPIGPGLSPLGVNVGLVVKEINDKTKSFVGMQVPVSILVNPNKTFEIKVGIPPTSALIKKELSLEKGSGKSGQENIADILIEQVIKVAKQKEAGMAGATLKERVKQIVGTCGSMGIFVESKKAKDVIKEIDAGKYDKEIKAEKTELTKEELEQIKKEREELKAHIEKEHAERRARAEAILKEMEGKEKVEIRRKMKEAGLPDDLIEELVPHEATAAAAAAKPGAKAAQAKK